MRPASPSCTWSAPTTSRAPTRAPRGSRTSPGPTTRRSPPSRSRPTARRSQARQLLDQLLALQRTDGSLDFAYDTATGASVQVFRTGTIAWVGYAALLHKLTTGTSRYDALINGTARWLLARQLPSGLLAGGPDVTWASTQHNLIAYQFLASGLRASTYATRTRSRRDRREPDDHARVRPAGVRARHERPAAPARRSDARHPVSSGARPLRRRAEGPRVHRVDRVQARQPQIVKSSSIATYNQSYSATGPFTGYRPYASAGPEVTGLLGIDNSAWDKALASWRNVTSARAKDRCRRTRPSPTTRSTSTTCGLPRPPRAGASSLSKACPDNLAAHAARDP